MKSDSLSDIAVSIIGKTNIYKLDDKVKSKIRR